MHILYVNEYIQLCAFLERIYAKTHTNMDEVHAYCSYLHFAHILEAHGYCLIVAVPTETYGGSVKQCSPRFKPSKTQ